MLICVAVFFPQSSSHAGDQELVSRMKSLELENQTLHKGLCLNYNTHVQDFIEIKHDIIKELLVVKYCRAAVRRVAQFQDEVFWCSFS